MAASARPGLDDVLDERLGLVAGAAIAQERSPRSARDSSEGGSGIDSAIVARGRILFLDEARGVRGHGRAVAGAVPSTSATRDSIAAAWAASSSASVDLRALILPRSASLIRAISPRDHS